MSLNTSGVADVDACCAVLNGAMSQAVEQATNTVNMKCNSTGKGCPWFNEELKSLMKYRDCWYQKYKREKIKEKNNQYYSPFVEMEFKKYDMMLKKLRSDLKQKYFEKKFKKCEGNPKNIWSLYKEMMYNVQPERSKDSIELHIENKVVNNDLAVAEYFNDYFATVAADLASTFPPTKVEHNHRVRSRFGCFIPATEEEIRSVIGKLKRSESIISDAISSIIVKECAEIVTPAITNIVNVSLEKGFFPTSCKLAKVVPVFKSGSPRSTHNYRPISILSALSKII